MAQVSAFPQPQIRSPAINIIRSLPFGRKASYLLYNWPLKRWRANYRCRTYFGAWMNCDPRDFIQRMIFNFAFWEPDISAAISANLKPGDIFVDVGANVGYYTLLGASCVGPQGLVYAIEADPHIYKKLESNVALNGAQNIRPLNIAAGGQAGKVTIYSGPKESLGTTTLLADRGFAASGEVDMDRLTSIIAPADLRRVAFIKIDIEGAEVPVVDDILDHADSFAPELKLLVEISPRADANWQRIFRRFIELGFSAQGCMNDYDDLAYLAWRTPARLVPLDALPDQQMDVLFSRREKTS